MLAGVYTTHQVLLAQAVGADYVAPYLGRMADKYVEQVKSSNISTDVPDVDGISVVSKPALCHWIAIDSLSWHQCCVMPGNTVACTTGAMQ